MSNKSKTTDVAVIALDMGGTWIKGCAATKEAAIGATNLEKCERWPNPLAGAGNAAEYAGEIQDICEKLADGRRIGAVVAATAGEVDASGTRYICAGSHLGVMVSSPWVEQVASSMGCPVTLINDAEAFMLGLAVTGELPVNQASGGLVVGTGLGFAIVRNGRWWKPGRRTIHLGAVKIPGGDYDAWTSAVRAAQLSDGHLGSFLAEDRPEREEYVRGISRVAATAATLYHLDDVIIGGGLVDAAFSVGFDLVNRISLAIPELLPPNFTAPKVRLAKNGNATALIGALTLAGANAAAGSFRFRGTFGSLATEQSAGADRIELLPSEDIARKLASAEADAAADFVQESAALGQVADRIASALQEGGRVIYVGAGTSGRIGALDAVEIPCTFGLSPDCFVAVIAGGLADAALTIEENFEEDHSSVPDLMLLRLSPKDVVIGISASGSAFFVRSALAFARACGSGTVFIHESKSPSQDDPLRDCIDFDLRLHSGAELVSGSTRMKAGTATKKALNILSTTAMIRLGKVRSGYMIDLQCTNEKLRSRARGILRQLSGLTAEEAAAALEQNGYQLSKTLDSLGI